MALTATIYNLDVELADVDRGVYESLTLRVAREPSETAEYMLTRVLAYCLEYTEGIALTGGVASGDEPAVVVRDLTGRLTAWIEVGMPDAGRVHRGSKMAGRVAVYTHRDPGSSWRSGRGAHPQREGHPGLRVRPRPDRGDRRAPRAAVDPLAVNHGAGRLSRTGGLDVRAGDDGTSCVMIVRPDPAVLLTGRCDELAGLISAMLTRRV